MPCLLCWPAPGAHRILTRQGLLAGRVQRAVHFRGLLEAEAAEEHRVRGLGPLSAQLLLLLQASQHGPHGVALPSAGEATDVHRPAQRPWCGADQVGAGVHRHPEAVVPHCRQPSTLACCVGMAAMPALLRTNEPRSSGLGR